MFIVGNLGPALALDRMGRRKTMLYGCFGLGICMMMASILLSFGKKNTSSAAVAFFFVYMIIVSHLFWSEGLEDFIPPCGVRVFDEVLLILLRTSLAAQSTSSPGSTVQRFYRCRLAQEERPFRLLRM